MTNPCHEIELEKFKETNSYPIIGHQQVILGNNTIATAFPVNSVDEICDSLLNLLHTTFNKEIELGKTYPYFEQLSLKQFKSYWFSHFVQVLVKGQHNKSILKDDSADWDSIFLGTNYIKPNYVGRASHICNSGFLVSFNNRGSALKVGNTMGKLYLKWAPKLGYTYSVFNLVFVSNVASVRIWDSLGFDRIGLVPKAAFLKGDSTATDAIIFGRKLEGE